MTQSSYCIDNLTYKKLTVIIHNYYNLCLNGKAFHFRDTESLKYRKYPPTDDY